MLYRVYMFRFCKPIYDLFRIFRLSVAVQLGVVPTCVRELLDLKVTERRQFYFKKKKVYYTSSVGC